MKRRRSLTFLVENPIFLGQKQWTQEELLDSDVSVMFNGGNQLDKSGIEVKDMNKNDVTIDYWAILLDGTLNLLN